MLRTDASGTNSARQGHTKDTARGLVICNGLTIRIPRRQKPDSPKVSYADMNLVV